MEDKNSIIKGQTKLSGRDYLSLSTNKDWNDENGRNRDYWGEINLSIESLLYIDVLLKIKLLQLWCGLVVWWLTPLSTIFQLYHGG
jgi:hypothetical protein